MKFDLTQEDYGQFIKDLRNEAKDVNRTSHGLPVLPPPPQNIALAEYIDIELTVGGSPRVTVRIRRHDLHLIGYRIDNGQWYEFGRDEDRQLIPGSEFLGFGESYLDLGGLENLPNVGYTPLAVGINQLAITANNDERSALRLLAVMICESARFDRLLNDFAAPVHENLDIEFEGWMVTLIHAWGDLSLRLQQGVNFHLPPDGNGNPNFLTRDVEIETDLDAAECLGLLLPRNPRQQRQPLLQVFSVRIDNIVC